MPDAVYNEDVVVARLQEHMDEIVGNFIKTATDFPPVALQQDQLPATFFIPGAAIYQQGRGAEYWITAREYLCELVIINATDDKDFKAARSAARLLSEVRRKWMAVERLRLTNGTAINVRALRDGGIRPQKRGDQWRYVVEFSIQVKFEEHIVNTGY